MNPLNDLVKFLEEVISQESSKDRDVLAGYIVGELLGDYDKKYEGLYDNNPTVQRIGDLASDLERSNGSEEQLAKMWNELKELTDQLKQ